MGQFTLGIRSLLIKATIFVIMAALLAWALGGTLWPRPARVELPAGIFLGDELAWKLSVHDGIRLTPFPERSVRWELAYRGKSDRKWHVMEGLEGLEWIDVSGPVRFEDKLYVGARQIEPEGSGNRWEIVVVDEDHHIVGRSPMPDRLAVEQQLARLRAGLPLQDAETIQRQRDAVLDPEPKVADESE
jgi:hypothetical protein